MSIDDQPVDDQPIFKDAVPVDEEVPQGRFSGFHIPDFLKAPTGAGSIDNYIDHPMNFNNSKPVAQVLRGLTGMFNSLDYAVIDIGLGLMKMKKTPTPPTL